MEGKLLAAVGEDQLQSGGTFDRTKVVAFAAAHAPVKPDARKLLDEALAQARREKKHVLLDESAPYCPPCVSLSKYLQRNRALISKDFVVVTLDRRFANGAEVMKRLRKDDVSTPWTAVLDVDGKTLITSDGPGGNIGYPGDASGRTHWEKMLRTGAWRLTEAEVRGLLGQLDYRP
jgi:hypothetical protein